jgi:hypothetical protein
MAEEDTPAAVFDVETAQSVFQKAARNLDLDCREGRLIRLGENAIFHLPSTGIIVRIARSMKYWAVAVNEVNVSTWLNSVEFPAVQLHDVAQPMDIDGHPVTFWRFIDGRPGRREDLPILGSVLRKLHALSRPESFPLPETDILSRIPGRIVSADIPQKDRGFLAHRTAELADEVARLDFPLPSAPTHGDAHNENLIIQNDIPFLIDLEGFSWGQPEWDLATTATEYATAGWWTAKEYKSFADAYGFDVMQWGGFEVVRSVHELKMTTWLMQNAKNSSEIAEEFQVRMETLRTGQPSHWRPF